MVLSYWVSMKRVGVNYATTAISGKEFGEGSLEIIGDKGGDDVFFAIRDDKEMAGTNSVEVVLPSRTQVNAWLRTIGTGSPSFYVSVHCFGFQCVSFGLLVQDHGHGGDRGRGTRWDSLDKGRDDW